MEISIVQYSSSSSMTKSATGALVGGDADNNGSSVKDPHSSAPCTNQVSSEKRKTRKMMPFLPEEIIFKIFLLLPAKVLHEVMRTVCRTWRKVIRDPVFIKSHLCRSPITPSLLRDGDQISWIFDKTVISLPNKINQNYVADGDGLLLTSNRKDPSILYLINPLTKQIVTLPRLPVGMVVYSYITRLFAVGFSPSTLECKVAFSNYYTKTTYILTVGVDKEWRAILVESNTTSMPLYTSRFADGIWGFIYWYNYESNYLNALDVEREVFYKVHFPEECGGGHVVSDPSSDRFLSFACTPYSKWLSKFVEVVFWELVDCKNGGEWRKLGMVDLESKRTELVEMGVWFSDNSSWIIIPVAVLSSRDVAIFRYGDIKFVSNIAYNFKTGKFFRCLDSLNKCFKECYFRNFNNLVLLKT